MSATTIRADLLTRSEQTCSALGTQVLQRKNPPAAPTLPPAARTKRWHCEHCQQLPNAAIGRYLDQSVPEAEQHQICGCGLSQKPKRRGHMRQLKRDLCNKPTLTSNSSKTRERIKSKQIMLGVIPWATTAAPSCKIPPAAENGAVQKSPGCADAPSSCQNEEMAL